MRHMSAGLATIVGAAALLSVGCTESRELRGFDNTAWTPYVSEYGPNTGVTGSSASPYVGGGIINQKPDPVVVPARVHTTTTTYTTPSTTIYTSPAPADPATDTTIIRREY